MVEGLPCAHKSPISLSSSTRTRFGCKKFVIKNTKKFEASLGYMRPCTFSFNVYLLLHIKTFYTYLMHVYAYMVHVGGQIYVYVCVHAYVEARGQPQLSTSVVGHISF